MRKGNRGGHSQCISVCILIRTIFVFVCKLTPLLMFLSLVYPVLKVMYD